MILSLVGVGSRQQVLTIIRFGGQGVSLRAKRQEIIKINQLTIRETAQHIS